MKRVRTIKVYETEVTVEGRGAFPVDMMRYDTCYPATESDANAIRESFADPSGVTRVRLNRRSVSDREPQYARWESFGWRVVATGPVGDA